MSLKKKFNGIYIQTDEICYSKGKLFGAILNAVEKTRVPWPCYIFLCVLSH